MRRRLLLLNMVLLALVAATGWQLRVRWVAAGVQERKVLQPLPKMPSPVAEPPEPAPQPAAAMAYADVAEQVLFSPDRNPNVAVAVEQPKTVPPFPLAYGLMILGGGPVVILSETAGAPNHGYSAGDKVGPFTLVALEGETLVLEHEGRTFRKTFQELKPQPGTQPPEVAVSYAPASPAPMVQSLSAAAAPGGPGPEAAPGQRACVPGDDSPAGTVRDGYRKVVRKTPFGASCHWEPAK